MPEQSRLLNLADEPVEHLPGTLFPADPVTQPPLDSCQHEIVYLFERPERDGDVRVDACNPQFLHLSRIGLPWNPLARLKVLRVINRVCPDVLLVQGPMARAIGLSAARSFGVPLRQVLAPGISQWLTSSLLGTIVRSNENATRFITDSFAAAQRLIRQEQVHRDRIDILRWGVDVSCFGRRSEGSVAEAKHLLGLSAHEPVILAWASRPTSQDFDTLFYAVRQLRPHQKDVRLILWGVMSPESRPELSDAIKRHGIDGHVIVLPFDASFTSCIAAADVGVATAYAESSQPFLLACMAAGLPCVAVNLGGNNELLNHGESGYLVDVKDPDQLAMFITILLLSPELSARFGDAAREHVKVSHSMEAALRSRADFFRMMAYQATGR